MTAPLTFLAPQTFDRACDRLSDAQASYTDAVNELVEAKCTLEFKRAELLEKGIEGKNAGLGTRHCGSSCLMSTPSYSGSR